MMRFQSQHRQALEMIQADKLGKLTYGRAQLSCWYPPIDGAWRQEAILRRFALSNGVYKRTAQSRFAEFDHAVTEFLSDKFANEEVLQVHDVAVSDGRTSVEFYDRLRRELMQSIEFYATDRDLEVFALHKNGCRTSVVIDSEGTVLQIVHPPFVFNVCKPESKLLYPINHLIRWLLTPMSILPVKSQIL